MIAKFYFYRNLHTGTFSVQHKQKVTDHPKAAIACGCTFKVSETLRKRVVETKRKNVHAKVGCTRYAPESQRRYVILDEVTYNPYTHEQFLCNGLPIYNAKYVLLKDNRIYLIRLL